MFNGLLFYFIFLVGSHVILKFLVYQVALLFALFFLCCRISILPIIAYRHVLISNLSS